MEAYYAWRQLWILMYTPTRSLTSIVSMFLVHR